MVFEETSPLLIFAPIAIVIVVAVIVFFAGFRTPENLPNYAAFQESSEEISKKKKKKAKKSVGTTEAASVSTAKTLKAANAAEKKKAISDQEAKGKKSLSTAETKKASLTAEAKPKRKPKKANVIEKEDQLVPSTLEEDSGDWMVAKSRKRIQQKGKDNSTPPSPSPVPVVATEKVTEQQLPERTKAKKKTKQKDAQAPASVTEPESAAEPVIQKKRQSSADSSEKQDDGCSSPAHSITTGSSLSESWVSPDEMQNALREFDSVLSSQTSSSSGPSPNPSNATKKKKKKNKASKNVGELSTLANSGNCLVEEPVVTPESSTPLGDRGNPYRVIKPSSESLDAVVEEPTAPVKDVAMDAAALAVVAEELAASKEKAKANQPSESAKGTTKIDDLQVDAASPAALSEEWVEAKVQKKKKRVRRDN